MNSPALISDTRGNGQGARNPLVTADETRHTQAAVVDTEVLHTAHQVHQRF